MRPFFLDFCSFPAVFGILLLLAFLIFIIFGFPPETTSSAACTNARFTHTHRETSQCTFNSCKASSRLIVYVNLSSCFHLQKLQQQGHSTCVLCVCHTQTLTTVPRPSIFCGASSCSVCCQLINGVLKRLSLLRTTQAVLDDFAR